MLGGNNDTRQPEESMAINLSYVQDMGNGTFFAYAGYKHTGDYLLAGTGAGAGVNTFDGDYQLWDVRVAYDLRLKNDAVLSLSLAVVPSTCPVVVPTPASRVGALPEPTHLRSSTLCSAEALNR